jgi:myo-inositol-1(or 4)-monophosphatase
MVRAMDDIERVARAAVAEAGERLRAAWQGAKEIEHKGTLDLVTATDREVEALVANRLRQAFPSHVIIAEEASAASGPQRPRADAPAWYLDPLDGTTNFAHAYPQFAVSLALARGTEIDLGIVYDPMRDETFFARRGRGATLNGIPIQVSAVETLADALLGTGFPYDRRDHIDFYLGFLRQMMLRAQGVRRAGAAALDLCWVACGRFDGFWEWKLSPWDTAAGCLIVREAGGIVTDFRAGPFDLFGQQTLASNGKIHARMVEVLSAQLERRLQEAGT